jgi:hypothetical protein
MRWIRKYLRQITLGMLITLFIFLLFVMTQPILAEWWTIHIARRYHLIFARLFEWIPFSLMEILIVSWALISFLFILKTLRFVIQKSWKRSFVSLQKSVIFI